MPKVSTEKGREKKIVSKESFFLFIKIKFKFVHVVKLLCRNNSGMYDDVKKDSTAFVGQ